METIKFNKLLLKSAFCCIASDGHIDIREITILKNMCEKSPLFKDLDFLNEINSLVVEINTIGKEIFSNFFNYLEITTLTEQEELALIDFAIQTIKADEKIEYSEIKFFKNIRYRLKVSDANILTVFPDIEQFLEPDIINETHLSKITNQYLAISDLPHFDLIAMDHSSFE